MEPSWEMALPLLDHFQLSLFSFIVGSICVLFFRRRSQTKAAAKRKASTQEIIEKIRKLRALELEEAKKYATASDMACISGRRRRHHRHRRKDQTKDCVLCSIDRSFDHIFQYLDNASSALKDPNSSESDYMSSSTLSDTVSQKLAPPCCSFRNGKHSSNYNSSSGSSNSSSILSDSVELTPKVPCSATDSRKVTPMALLQDRDSMGTIPDSHSEVTDSVELTPKVPCSVTDSRKVTPMALLQAMKSMGMVTESRLEDTDSMGKTKDQTNLSQPSNQAETVSIPPQSSNPVASPQHQTRESKSLASRLNQITNISNETPMILFNIMNSRELVNELCSHVTEPAGIAPKPQHQDMKSVGVNTLHKHQVVEPAKVSLGPHRMVFKARERIPQPQHKVPETLNMESGSQNQATKQIRFTPSSLQPPQSSSKVLDFSRMVREPSVQSIKVNSREQGSSTGVIPPLEAGLIAQSVAQAKESLELPSASQVQVRDSIGLTPHPGTEKLSLTPKPPHQVMDPSEFTPWHQDLDCSEVSPRQNHKMIEPMELTSDTWPQWKNPTERTPSHHQITESMTTAPGAPDQGTVPTGMSQRHQLIQSEVMPATPKLQEVECLEKNTTPQPTVMESVNLTPELQNVYSKNLVPDPELQDIKPVDISIDLVPEIVIDGLLTPTVVSTDLAPEQQQSIQSEELTPIPQLQTENPVPSALESQLQDVKSIQLTVEPQVQNVKSAGLVPNPQMQITETANLTPGSQSQGMEGVHSALPQEVQEDIKMASLTPRLSLEGVKSANLAPKQCSQNTSSEKIAHVPLLEDTKIPFVDCRSLIPESLVESMKVGELTTHIYAVKSADVGLNSSYSFPEPEGLTEQQQASEARVTSDTCHQVEESAESTQSSVGVTPAPPSQTSESAEMNLPPPQDILETRIHLVKEVKETPEDILNLLPELEVPTIIPEEMFPEPPPPDVDVAHVTKEPCSEVTNPSEISLYEYTESIKLTLSEVDDSQGTTIETYLEMRSQGLNLEPRVQTEESESLVEKLEIEELTSEQSVLVIEPIELTTGPISHVIDVIPGPQGHNITSTQIDSGLELQSVLSVDLVQQTSIRITDPEITKPEPGLQTLSTKESVEGTQISNVKSVDLNLGQQQSIVQSGLTPGPQLQSVRFPKLYEGLLVQGDNPANSILGPPHYGVKSDEAISYSPMPEIRSSGFIPGPKVPEPQPQHVKSMKVNLGPSLQDVRFSDPIPEPKLQGFEYTQLMPGFPLQETMSQEFIPELLLPLSRELKLEDRKLALPIEGSEFHRMQCATQASDMQHPHMISEDVNTGPWDQDAKFSELASGPKLQGVKFGELISESMFVSGSSMTPELGIQDPNLAKMTPGLQDTRQMSFNSGPQLQDVKFWDGIPGTQPQGVKTSELNPGPHLACVKILELVTLPERQGMKTELVAHQSPFQDVKSITGNKVPSAEDKVSYEMVSEPQVPTSETTKSAPGRHLANADRSELTRRPQTQGIGSSELIEEQLLGHIKPLEKSTVLKQEALTSVELTPGLHLGDIKSTKSKSELEPIKFMLSTPGMQAGDRNLEGLPPGSSLKGLKLKFLPSKPTMEDRKSGILTIEECLKRIKSSVVSPSGSLRGDMKSVNLIPGSRIQDVKNKGLARGTHVQDVNTMDLKFEPKKQGESPVIFVPSMLFQDKSIEMFQELRLQRIKPKKLASQPQRQDRKPVIAPCLKHQSLKPVAVAQTQGTGEVKYVDFTSTQQYQGMAPMDLTPKSREDDQITVKTLEWKGGIFDQQKKQSESENILPMESAQELKLADIKPIEINPKLKFKDITSFELGPQPVVQSVKSEEFQNELQVPSMKPCQLTPGSQMCQEKALESTLDLQLQGVETMAQQPIGSTKTIQWIPISEFQSEKGVGSNSRPQSRDAGATELKPPMLWRSVKSSELTARSKIQGENMVAFHLNPQLQGVKTSPLAVGLQEPYTLHLTSEPQPQGITSEELNKEPKAESVRSVQWTPRMEFQSEKMSGSNSGSPFQGVTWTEQIPSIKLGGGKPSEMTQGPILQGKSSGDFYLRPQEQTPGTQSQESKPLKSSPGIQQPQEVTSSVFKQESQFLEGKFGILGQGSQSQNNTNTGLQSEKSSGLALQTKPQGTKTEMKSEPQGQSAKCSDLTTETKSEYMKCKLLTRSLLKSKPISTKIQRVQLDIKPGPQSEGIKSDSVLKTESQEMEMEDCESDPQLQDLKSLRMTMDVKVQDVKSMSFSPRPHMESMPSEVITEKSVLGMKPAEIKLCQKLQGETPEFTPRTLLLGTQSIGLDSGFNLQDLKYPELIMGMKIKGIGSMEQHLTSIKPSEAITQTNSQDIKTVDFDSEPSPQCADSPACIPGSSPQSEDSSACIPGSSPQCAESSACIPGPSPQCAESSACIPGPSPQCAESSACIPGPSPQCAESSACIPGPSPQCADSSACIPGPSPQCAESSACIPGPSPQCAESSACIPGPSPQSEDSSACIPGPSPQSEDSSACIPGPSPQCAESSACIPGPSPQSAESSACIPGPSPQCADSSACIPGPSPQSEDSSACIPGPSPQCAESSACIPGPSPQCAESSACIPGPSPQCAESSACIPGPSPQSAESSACIPGPSPQCAESSACIPGPSPQCAESSAFTPENPELHLQAGDSSVYTLGQNPLCENSNRYNLGPLFQDMNFSSFPPPQILCVNPVWCSTRLHLKDINSSECTLGQESQSVNSIGYNPGAHLQVPNLQEQHLKDVMSELSPGSNNLGTSPSQDVNLVLGATFQKIPVLKNQLGSQQQSTQPIFTLRPQSSGMNSVVLPTSPHMNSVVLPMWSPEDTKFPEKSTHTPFCTNAVKLTPGCGLNDLRSEVFSQEPGSQNVEAVQLKLASQSQTVSFSDEPVIVWVPQLLAGPALSSVKFSNLPLKSEQKNTKSLAFPSEPKRPGVKQVRLSSVSLLETEKSEELPPKSIFQTVSPGNLMPQTIHPLTESMRPERQVEDFAEMSMKPRCQVPKLVHFTSPISQDVGSLEFTDGLGHKNTEMTEKSMRLSSKPTDNILESLEMPPKLDLQVLEFLDLTPTPSDHDSKSSEPNLQKSYQIPEAPELPSWLWPQYQDLTPTLSDHDSKSSEPNLQRSYLIPEAPELPSWLWPQYQDLTPTLSDHDSKSSESNLQKSYQIPEPPELPSWLWPQFQDFEMLQTKEVTESDRMTLSFMNHVADTIELTCEARQEEKEFLRMTPKPVNRETGFTEESPGPCPQDLGPLGVDSKERSQREQSAIPTRSFCPVPDSTSGITPGPGPQIPKSKNLASMVWLPRESFELAGKQTSQVMGARDSVELTFGTQQSGGVAAQLTKPQNLSLENVSNPPTEPLDEVINVVGTSLKPRDQVTESVKTQLSVAHSVALPKVCQSVEVISVPPVQVTKSVVIPESIPQKPKYNDLTPRTHDVISSEFASSLRLQNMQSKRLTIEPKHQVLETKQRPGFPLIKTVITPKPFIQVVKSEEVAPGPCPQAVEPLGLAMRPSIRVKGCLNVHPRPHLQDVVKPMELTQSADIQVTSAELISQQASPLKEPTVLTHEQRPQAGKSLGLKTESPQVMKIEDSNQGSVCQNKASEMITSAKLEAENYLSRSIHNPSIPFLSSIDRTTELGHSQGSGVPEISRAFGMENFGVGILQSSKSYTDSTMIKSSFLPLILQNLPSGKTGDTKGTPYPDIWSMNVFSKQESKKKMEEFQRYSSYSFRLLSGEFQAGLVARRNSIRSFLGRQQNVWESHVRRLRLPRKYLSDMLMLGNVLGTTMERKPCSQAFSIEGSTMDSCQPIENLFGVPAELMELSQSLLERVPRTMSQTSVDKKYIQRHILLHGNEKRMPLKMWTRGSISSIIQQYFGTRLGVKKTSSKHSSIFQEGTEHVSVSCTGAPFPALMTSEILYRREDSVSKEQSKISPCASSRTFESQHSKTSSLSQSKTDNSEHLQLLRELQLKIARKLISSQMPHNVPPPLESGLVLKYPICLECGRCSGFNCGHQSQSDMGPYLLVYPQLHLLNTPEGRGDFQLRLGFKLGYPRGGAASPSGRKGRFSTPPSKRPDYERNQDETWIKSSFRKTSVLTDPLKKIVKGPKTKKTNLYKLSPRTLRGLSRNRPESRQTSTVSSKTQPQKSSRRKIIQPLFQGLRQAFQAAHRIVTFTGQKLKKMRPYHLCSVKNLHPKRSAKNSSFMGDSEGARTPGGRLRSTRSSPKQKDPWQGGSERGRQAPQPKRASSFLPRLLPLQKTMVCGRDVFKQDTPVPEIVQNVYSDEAPKTQPQQLGFFTERTLCDKASERTHCRLPQRTHWRILSERRHHSPARRHSSPSDKTLRKLFERSYHSPSQRNSLSSSVRSVSDRSHNSQFKWRGHSPSRRSPRNPSRRSPRICSRRSSHSPWRSPCSPSRRIPRDPSRRKLRSPSRRRPQNPSGGRYHSPSESSSLQSPSGKIRHSSSRSPHIPSRRSFRGPSRKIPRSPSRRSPQILSGGSSYYSPSVSSFPCPSGKSLYSPSRSPSIPSRRSPHSPSGRSLHRRSRKNLTCLLGRNLRSPSGRSPHRRSRRSPCRPLERRGHSPSEKKSLNNLSGRSQQSPSSLRCLSPSKKSHLRLMRKSQGSPSERSHGSFSERSFSLHSGWTRMVLASTPTLLGNSQVCSSGVGLYPNMTWQEPGMPLPTIT